MCAVSLLCASPAQAVPALHGRGARAQAAIDASLVSQKGHAVQVLDQLCRRPTKETGCTPISARMRAALEGAIDRRIEWVHHRDPRAAESWIFAPVVFGGQQAEANDAFWGSGVGGCAGFRGGETLDFRLDHGNWVWSGGLAWARCSAGSA
jgi:hypothetical protein